MVLTLAAVGPVAGDPVTVRAAAHEDYGRVVFNWPSPVTYSASLDGRILTIRFGRAIEATFGAAVRELGKYISGATPGGDGRSVRFTLKGDFEIRNFDMGRAIVVDMVDEAETPAKSETAAPAAGRPAPAAAASAPQVKVRTGQHPEYTRIVFDWPSKVGYRLDEGPDSVTLRFDRAARIDLKRLQSRPPRYVSGATATVADDGVVVRLNVPPTSRIRHFLSGPKVVVDVMKPGTKKAVEKEALAPAPMAPVTTGAEAPKPVAKAEASSTAAETPSSSAAAATSQSAEPAQTAEATSGAVKTKGAAANAPAADPAAASGTGTNAVAARAPARPSTPTLLRPGRRRGDSTPRSDVAAAAAAPATGGTTPAGAAPQAAPIGDAIGIRFDWTTPVAAAVFRRAGGLWVVFDKPSTQDTAALAAQAGNIVRDIRQVPADQATALRMSTVSGINPSIRREGTSWILEFRKQALIASTPILPKVRADVSKGSRVFLPIREPGPAIAIADPEVGDTLVVVPVIPLGYGMDRQRTYPQFRLLQTVQGIVIEPRIDNLLIKSIRRGVELTSPSRLQVSAVSARDQAGAQIGAQRELTRLFDFKRWTEVTPATFYDERRKLEDKVSQAKARRQEKRRFDLVRFFFAGGYAAEAIGIMRVMNKGRPELLNNPEFRALRGAAHVVMGHLEDAAADLYHPSLQNNDEARFWQAVLRAREGDMKGAARFLRHLGGIIQPYPKALKVPLGLLVAEGGIALGSVRTARTFLDLVEAESPKPADRAELGYLSGLLAEMSGDADSAVSEWEQVQTGPNRPSRARATKARTEILLKKKGDGTEGSDRGIRKPALCLAWR